MSVLHLLNAAGFTNLKIVTTAECVSITRVPTPYVSRGVSVLSPAMTRLLTKKTPCVFDNPNLFVAPTEWPKEWLKSLHTNLPPRPYDIAALLVTDTRLYPPWELTAWLQGVSIKNIARLTHRDHRTVIALVTPWFSKYFGKEANPLSRARLLAFPENPYSRVLTFNDRRYFDAAYRPSSWRDRGGGMPKPSSIHQTRHLQGIVANPYLRPWLPQLRLWPSLQDKKNCLTVLTTKEAIKIHHCDRVRIPQLQKLYSQYGITKLAQKQHNNYPHIRSSYGKRSNHKATR